MPNATASRLKGKPRRAVPSDSGPRQKAKKPTFRSRYDALEKRREELLLRLAVLNNATKSTPAHVARARCSIRLSRGFASAARSGSGSRRLAYQRDRPVCAALVGGRAVALLPPASY